MLFEYLRGSRCINIGIAKRMGAAAAVILGLVALAQPTTAEARGGVGGGSHAGGFGGYGRGFGRGWWGGYGRGWYYPGYYGWGYGYYPYAYYPYTSPYA